MYWEYKNWSIVTKIARKTEILWAKKGGWPGREMSSAMPMYARCKGTLHNRPKMWTERNPTTVSRVKHAALIRSLAQGLHRQTATSLPNLDTSRRNRRYSQPHYHRERRSQHTWTLFHRFWPWRRECRGESGSRDAARSIGTSGTLTKPGRKDEVEIRDAGGNWPDRTSARKLDRGGRKRPRKGGETRPAATCPRKCKLPKGWCAREERGCGYAFVCVSVCVCVKERERERRGDGSASKPPKTTT